MAQITSRILDEMLETARGPHQTNMIDKCKLGEIDALCQSTVEPMPPTEIKGLS